MHDARCGMRDVYYRNMIFGGRDMAQSYKDLAIYPMFRKEIYKVNFCKHLQILIL